MAVPIVHLRDDAVPLLDKAAVETARLRRAARAALVTTSPSVTYAMLAVARQTDENAARQWVRRRRDKEQLFGVEHDGTVLFPSFQFDADFDVREDVAHVNELLADRRLTPWERWHWWASTNPWNDRPPVDLLADTKASEALVELVERLDSGEG